MDEFWAPILDFPDYSISSLGRVRNDRRDKIMHPSMTKQGALKVGLVKGGKQYGRSVKVLVAETFVDGATVQFNTPMILDYDQTNCQADNIVWRPRWFAWKYARQHEDLDKYVGRGPLVDRKTGVFYNDIVEAATANGLLFYELHMSVVNKTPVFPIWHIFDWTRR